MIHHKDIKTQRNKPINKISLCSLCLCGFILLARPLAAQTLNTCGEHRHRGRLAEAERCWQQLTTSTDPSVRAEAWWGLGRYQEANEQFRAAVKLRPNDAGVRVRWGRLFLERAQRRDAAQLFEEALGIDKQNTGALVGLALVASEGFDSKAVELAEKAIALEPRLAEARVLLARLALEDGDSQKAAAEADKALATDPESLEAMAIRATIDWLNDEPATPWIGRILEVNPAYGEAYATAGHFHVLNRRYEEGVRFYRKALELNTKLLKARTELGVNLMRLGLDEEARWHLEYCYTNGDRYAAVVNPLRLLDSYKNFETFATGGAVVKLHKRDAVLLRPYFETEIQRAIAALEKKYRMRLEQPARVEAYPDHEDFAVRTVGMPGLGASGVTFGYVVAMDSPNGRKPGAYHWTSTLWHEMSHVFVLAATRHRVPRWFTEGMAVHEETAVSPEWGDRLSPEVIQAIRKDLLLPVTRLDRGFVRPTYPAQVLVSYFQTGRICDYIAREWGFEKLLAMMHAFAARKTTAAVIEQELGLKSEEFDKRFLAWLRHETSKTVAGYDVWNSSREKLAEAARAGRHDDVIREAGSVLEIYPDYVDSGSVYELLAEAHLAKGEKPAATAVLERYARAGGRSPDVLKKLASLQEEQGRGKAAAETLDRLNFIFPRDEALQRKLGDLWLAEDDPEKAIRAYRSLLALKPLDRAAAHFNLARACRAAKRLEDAREQVLLALEAAPGYRPAQKLLLEISK